MLPPTAILAALCATLVATFPPGRSRDDLHDPHGLKRIVAGDHQVAGPGELLPGVIAQTNLQTSAGAQRGRERIVDELPMSIGVAERNARDVQLALANIADRESPFGESACRHPAKERRARYGQLART